jgi:hypothetical protein
MCARAAHGSLSSTREPEYDQSTPQAEHVLCSSRPADRDACIAAAERELLWASRRYLDPAALRVLATENRRMARV